MPKLRGLCLLGSRIGDLRLDYVAKLKNLELLVLDGTDITDEGLRCLADLKNLRALTLRDTAVTDAGLEWLGDLDKLEVLDFNNTRVTEEGVNRLKNIEVRPRPDQRGNRNDRVAERHPSRPECAVSEGYRPVATGLHDSG